MSKYRSFLIGMLAGAGLVSAIATLNRRFLEPSKRTTLPGFGRAPFLEDEEALEFLGEEPAVVVQETLSIEADHPGERYDSVDPSDLGAERLIRATEGYPVRSR